MIRNTLIRRLMLDDGGCCIAGYLTRHESQSDAQIARRLGVHERTVRKWRKKLRDGDCSCEGRSRCYLSSS